MQKGAGEIHQAPPATGEPPRGYPGVGCQAGPLDGARDRLAYGRSGEAGKAGSKREVLLHRQKAVDTDLLKDETESPTNGLALAADIMAEDSGLASGWGEEGCQQQHRRGLAGPIGPENPDHSAWRHDQIERVERAYIAVVASQPLSLDRERKSAHARTGSPAM